MDSDKKLIELEAKLFAHRRLIMILLKRLAEQCKEPEKFWEELSETAIVQDHQEDPGVVQPDLAFAYNAITEFEYTRLVAEAKA
jgi:hypothetical protein